MSETTGITSVMSKTPDKIRINGLDGVIHSGHPGFVMAVEHGVFVGLNKDDVTIFLPNSVIEQLYEAQKYLRKKITEEQYNDIPF